MALSLVEELRENLRSVQHLSSDEQLRMLDDRQFSMAEERIAEGEKVFATDLSLENFMNTLAQGISHHGKERAKVIFATLVCKRIEGAKMWIAYWSELQERFPYSSRVSSLAKREAANYQHLLSMLKVVEDC